MGISTDWGLQTPHLVICWPPNKGFHKVPMQSDLRFSATILEKQTCRSLDDVTDDVSDYVTDDNVIAC